MWSTRRKVFSAALVTLVALPAAGALYQTLSVHSESGFSPAFARKTLTVGGLVFSPSTVGANYVDSAPMIMVFPNGGRGTLYKDSADGRFMAETTGLC